MHMPRDRKSGQRRNRTATHQQTHCFRWETYDLPEPISNLTLYINRSMIPAGTARVRRCSERVSKDPDSCWRRIHPTPKTGMSVSEWVRLDLAGEYSQYIVHLLS
jgi:hypothetical protein